MKKIVVVLAFAISAMFTSGAFAQSKIAILMPGSAGAVPNDFLVRNKDRIGGKGISTVITTSSSEAASISQAEAAKGRKVVLVGMSRGAIDVAAALAAGAKVNGLVIVSGMYREAQARLGSPSLLPRTLLIHNKYDTCKFTLPEFASQFAAWSGGRASVRWVNVQGPEVPRVCGPMGAHGFYRQDGGAVATINSFIRSR
ncbi:MAG: hypothetical protein J0H71_02590 [Rhizobiales bacterium]|nr:hypothetical protein [Hyphomicrobiales bacterium]